MYTIEAPRSISIILCVFLISITFITKIHLGMRIIQNDFIFTLWLPQPDDNFVMTSVQRVMLSANYAFILLLLLVVVVVSEV